MESVSELSNSRFGDMFSADVPGNTVGELDLDWEEYVGVSIELENTTLGVSCTGSKEAITVVVENLFSVGTASLRNRRRPVLVVYKSFS